jgi:hypothetical protein
MASYNTQNLIDDFNSSGLTHKAYCTKKGIPTSTLAYHLRKHKNRLRQEAQNPGSPSFIPVDLRTEGSRFRTLLILKGEFNCEDLVKIVSSDL